MQIYKYLPLFAAVSAGTVVAALIRSEYEKECLEIVHYPIESAKIKQRMCLLFLSDMHEHEFGAGNVRLLEEIKRLSPDAILIGGDLMTVKRKVCFDAALRLCKEMAAHYPVYYANGNHEERLRDNDLRYGKVYASFLQKLKELGIIYLSDSSSMLTENIRITGLDIARKYYQRGKCPDMPVSYIQNRIGRSKTEIFEILLAHSPVYGRIYAKWGADLALSGHFHGGTIRLPGEIGLMSPQYQFFSHDVVGMRRFGKGIHIISAGLGTHSINIRLNNKPELIVLDLVPESGSV